MDISIYDKAINTDNMTIAELKLLHLQLLDTLDSLKDFDGDFIVPNYILGDNSNGDK